MSAIRAKMHGLYLSSPIPKMRTLSNAIEVAICSGAPFAFMHAAEFLPCSAIWRPVRIFGSYGNFFA